MLIGKIGEGAPNKCPRCGEMKTWKRIPKKGEALIMAITFPLISARQGLFVCGKCGFQKEY